MRHAWSIGFLVTLVIFCGCPMFTKGPMEVLTYANPNEDIAHRQLFVFMRGMGGSHRSFEEEGLIAGVRSRNLPVDMAAPNAHFGYYKDRTLIDRLKTDVIDLARSKGYDRIWLIGFSMGGLGSLLYQMEHPEDIAGVCLISPFLGDNSIVNEIAAAGGVRLWDPGAYEAEKDWERMLWHWLKTSVADHPEKNVYLGFGVSDRYAKGQRLLADILPEAHVHSLPGGHDYETFKTLWNLFLDDGKY